MRQLSTTIHAITPPSRSSFFQGPRYAPLKRVVDVLLAAGLLLICAPLMLLIAAAIKLRSPGPAFFRQRRVGRGGVPFTMLKFRSTRCVRAATQHAHAPHQGSELAGAGTHARAPAHAPRATRFDKLLRASGLDRLPRLINVLRGEMSLVGPRPALLHESELFDAHLRHRMSVLPGITGLWQVTARHKMPFAEMARIDLSYIETMNLWLDLTIMLRTPWALLGGK